uniref:Pentatricopeptide repeat-containing protein n=1 Tax=Kalanchoe fedtschenkoi TaxID=63787 RepID=A0A7N0TX46_KALFE
MSRSSHLLKTLTSDSVIRFLNKCCKSKDVKSIKRLHSSLILTGLLYFSQNLIAKLAQSYATCIGESGFRTLQHLFRSMNPTNSIPFNVIASEFCRKGQHLLALRTFCFMHGNGVPLDTYALCSSVKASCLVNKSMFGEQLHCLVVKSGWSSSVFIGSGLVDLYGKTGRVCDAEKVFDEIPVKNVVCVNALLTGFGEAKLWVEVLELVKDIPELNLVHDNFTLSASLRACAALSAVDLGKQVHGYALCGSCQMETDVYLMSSLIEMYGKCGFVESAHRVFCLAGIKQAKTRQRDLVVWTSMLGVYGKNGCHKEVISSYKEMLQEGIKPDEIVFLTVISACGHTGQVEIGLQYFNSMSSDFGLHPKPEHYSCIIDLLCRAGEVDKAWKVVSQMPNEGANSNCSVQLWGSLLSACLEHSDLDLGILAAQNAIELDPENLGLYLKLSNLYAKFQMWEEINQLRRFIRAKDLIKDTGCSRIEC